MPALPGGCAVWGQATCNVGRGGCAVWGHPAYNVERGGSVVVGRVP